jgi:hypothetical protein
MHAFQVVNFPYKCSYNKIQYKFSNSCGIFNAGFRNAYRSMVACVQYFFSKCSFKNSRRKLHVVQVCAKRSTQIENDHDNKRTINSTKQKSNAGSYSS